MQKQKTRYVILGLLSIESMSGYTMKRFITKTIGHFWSESNGQLYPTLEKLADEGLIMLNKRLNTGKKVCNQYAITETGRQALTQWLTQTTEAKGVHRDEELLKLFFGENADPKVCIEVLTHRLARIQTTLATYEELKSEVARHSSSAHTLFWRLVLQNGIYHAQAESRWCEESIQLLSSVIPPCS